MKKNKSLSFMLAGMIALSGVAYADSNANSAEQGTQAQIDKQSNTNANAENEAQPNKHKTHNKKTRNSIGAGCFTCGNAGSSSSAPWGR